jgi:hypothetical protein
MKWTLIISLGLLAIISLITIVTGLFSLWLFSGLIFYVLMYLAGFTYIRVGLLNKVKEEDDIYRAKQKFNWCWERANAILKAMPGGQGLEWVGGVGRKSVFKTYWDGVQNKPFRSMLAHLENTQQLVLIIFDIDGDDIALFAANPSVELIENPFLTFKPFSRGAGGGFDTRFGYPGGYPQRYPSRRGYGGRGVSINVDPGGQPSIEGFDEPQPRPITPTSETIDKAVDALDKK